jgi:ribosome-associated heat shock protein Hsp15
LDLGQRRGPAPDARALYDDLAPPEDSELSGQKAKSAATLRRASGRRPVGAGRPTKRDRRAVDRLLDG